MSSKVWIVSPQSQKKLFSEKNVKNSLRVVAQKVLKEKVVV